MSREAYRLRTVAPARGSQELTSRWTARLKSARQFPASSDVTSRPAHSRRSHPQRGLTSMPPHPANKGPGHHPAQHTRSQAVLGPHGARRKTPGEMGWVLLGGTITTLGQAAIDNGSWPSAARHAGNPPPPPPSIKRPPAPASVRSFKQQLKDIEKRYLEQRWRRCSQCTNLRCRTSDAHENRDVCLINTQILVILDPTNVWHKRRRMAEIPCKIRRTSA